NVMACPAPHHHDGVHAELQATAACLAAHFAPRTGAYHEIWLNGQPAGQASALKAAEEEEPLYGKLYLPRKFKMGLALPEDNCIDIFAQDLGFLAVVENGTVVGYNVLVGGGMGMTHGNAHTFPHLAKPIAYVSAVNVGAAAREAWSRSHAHTAPRRTARAPRLKPLVHDWGGENFQQVLAGSEGGVPKPPRPIEVRGFEAHLGCYPQGDGKWYLGLSIEN